MFCRPGSSFRAAAEANAQAAKQKLVLTTTVTESGVELLDGDRARLIIFADQSNTRTGKSEETAGCRGSYWRRSARSSPGTRPAAGWTATARRSPRSWDRCSTAPGSRTSPTRTAARTTGTVARRRCRLTR
ncbi:hypothetical protein EAO72_10135 [Streptomyces sp. or43]|nr:hypothetical protein EAO72_10135 [Streptomyces sp. or43]